MKVYACPKEIAFPDTDYANFNLEKELAREEQHTADLKQWLTDNGFDGPNTGRVYSVPVADGHASYMFADKGRSSFLVHLPYGAAYQSRDVEFVPEAEIIKRMDASDRLAEILKRAPSVREDDDSPFP